MLRDINRRQEDARYGIFQLNHYDTDAFEKAIWLEISV